MKRSCNGSGAAMYKTYPIQMLQHKIQKLKALIWELSSDDDSDTDSTMLALTTSPNLSIPWLQEPIWQQKTTLQDKYEIVQSGHLWWKISLQLWHHLCQVSVPFLSAGITISKWWNQLKSSDVIEVLQCLKCFIKQKLFFHDSDNPLAEVDVIESGRGKDGWNLTGRDLEDDEGPGFNDDNVLTLDWISRMLSTVTSKTFFILISIVVHAAHHQTPW